VTEQRGKERAVVKLSIKSCKDFGLSLDIPRALKRSSETKLMTLITISAFALQLNFTS